MTRRRRAPVAVLIVTASLACVPRALSSPRPLKPEDIFSLQDVSDPNLSPDGRSVAFEVARLDADLDESDTNIWQVPLAGGEAIRLTASPDEETTPRYSPDGRYLAFLSQREGNWTQVWLLDRRGGEAARLTDYPADVSDLAWPPDGTRLALVVKDAEAQGEKPRKTPKTEAAGDAEDRPKPIVIRRLKFKKDGVGYLTEARAHIYVFDVAARKSVK